MKEFMNPELVVQTFTVEDVITASEPGVDLSDNNTGGDGGRGNRT